MKRLLILLFLLSSNILFAQFSVGGSVNVSFPPHADPGIYDHTIGAVLTLGYEPTAHIKFQINGERQWVTSLMEEHRIHTITGEAKYIFLDGKARPFIGFGGGYAFENYEFPLDFGSVSNEGYLLGPTIGFIADLGFIKKAFIEIKISYDKYFFYEKLDFIKGSVGLVYKI